MALRTQAASPKSIVPTSSSFAASGTAGIFTAPRVARSAAGAVMTTDEVTAAAVVEPTAVVGRWLTWTACIGAESSDHAKPTGTARAATTPRATKPDIAYAFAASLRTTTWIRRESG